MELAGDTANGFTVPAQDRAGELFERDPAELAVAIAEVASALAALATARRRLAELLGGHAALPRLTRTRYRRGE
jgi:hypothetical protein